MKKFYVLLFLSAGIIPSISGAELEKRFLSLALDKKGDEINREVISELFHPDGTPKKKKRRPKPLELPGRELSKEERVALEAWLARNPELPSSPDPKDCHQNVTVKDVKERLAAGRSVSPHHAKNQRALGELRRKMSRSTSPASNNQNSLRKRSVSLTFFPLH